MREPGANDELLSLIIVSLACKKQAFFRYAFIYATSYNIVCLNRDRSKTGTITCKQSVLKPLSKSYKTL